MVTAKKHLGQHFLKDEKAAKHIVDALQPRGRYNKVLEIGPGMGVLTKYLFARDDFQTQLIEIDKESVNYLLQQFPQYQSHIIQGDFLNLDLHQLISTSANQHIPQLAIIGNFPYNISSQILFKVLDNRQVVPEVVGMFQKEVAERIASPPGSREYGILSVLMQAYYDVENILQLNQEDFSPPPKVKSAVLRFERKENFKLQCDEKDFRTVVKTAFNQRRKTLRNALKTYSSKFNVQSSKFMDKRAEQLSWKDFEELTLNFNL